MSEKVGAGLIKGMEWCRKVCSGWCQAGKQAVQKGPKGEPSLELMVEIIRSQQV